MLRRVMEKQEKVVWQDSGRVAADLNPTRGTGAMELLKGAATAVVASATWLERFAVPGAPDISQALLANLESYASRAAFDSYMAEMQSSGLVENYADVMDCARIFMAETISLMAMDAAGVHLSRLRRAENGTMQEPDAFRLEKMIAAVQRANKMAMELKESAGFARRIRKELGLGGDGGFQDMLKRILDEGSAVNSAQDVTGFLQESRLREHSEAVEAAEDAQVTFFEEAGDQRGLNEGEMRELTGRDGKVEI